MLIPSLIGLNGTPLNHADHRLLPVMTRVVALCCVALSSAHAQLGTDRTEGLRENSPRIHAITGARIVVSPGKVITKGNLVIQDGRVVAVGENVAVPAGARVWKLDGRTVYPGFIDLNSHVGVPTNVRPRAVVPFSFENPPQPLTPEEARVPGPRALSSQSRSIRADYDIATQLELKADEIKATRELGFTTVLSAPSVGILRGQSALINLADSTDAKTVLVAPRAAMQLANETERGFRGPYPTAMMGSIALLRQTLYDARWYKGASDAWQNGKGTERPAPNTSLDALQALTSGKQTAIYHAPAEQDFQRIAKIRDEFGLRIIALGNGYEYRRIADLQSSKLPVIVPLNFPQPPEIENPDHAIDVTLEQLQHWEQAPSNLAMLARAGVEFAVTTTGMENNGRDFWAQLRLAVKRGLASDAALAALTTTPARLIGAASQLGTLEPGRMANLTIANGDLFTSDTAEIELSFVDGRPIPTANFDRPDVRGKWQVAGSASREWAITGTRQKLQLQTDTGTCDAQLVGRQLIANLPCTKGTTAKETVVADLIGDTLRGTLQSGVKTTTWTATRVAPHVNAPVTDAAKNDAPTPAWAGTYPAGVFGVTTSHTKPTVLIKNTTVWTSAAAGKLSNTDMLIRDGRIAAVGTRLTAPPDATVIDAAGRHVTPGIIDPHSHTAVTNGINEGASSVTAEVRIADVLNATDVSIYRQLAGGVTAANVMHGSANTIGGQSQTIKMRWGKDAEALKFGGAMPGIKFALGENVKQANAQFANGRYPQTRMGVEQILRDAFLAAREYQAAWKNAPAGAMPPRRDLQLDALVEILQKKRVIHIHSYRADEILMFARLAKEFDITVATFQHVLEGYKVADAIASIGAGASTFTDWWAYKMEVIDAIPTNGAILHKAGVLTTFNSDSDELARRLNVEAGKAVRYGGIAETEALKFVTLNAAKQLRIDNRVGSLEVGKDADFVIWNANPLSPQARADETWVDGQRYFDRTTDARLRDEAQQERTRLIAKALPARLARMSIGSPRPTDAGARPNAAPSEVHEVFAFLALQRALHLENQYRGEYWNGGTWHECTEDGR